MLTRVNFGRRGQPSDLTLNYGVAPHLGGYDLISSSGLEPTATQVSYSEYASVPGGRYHSATQDVRTLSFRVGIHPPPGSGETVLSMRRKLYSALPPGKMVDIRLWNNGVYEFRIEGYVETIESDYFTQEPEVNLTFICPDPYFLAPEEVRLNELSAGTQQVEYLGDVPSGMTVTFNIRESLHAALQLHNDTTGDSIEVEGSWTAGERVRIQTIGGSRFIHYTDLGGSWGSPLLGQSKIHGGWPLLEPGINEIRADSVNRHRWDWNLWYTDRYGGF